MPEIIALRFTLCLNHFSVCVDKYYSRWQGSKFNYGIYYVAHSKYQHLSVAQRLSYHSLQVIPERNSSFMMLAYILDKDNYKHVLFKKNYFQTLWLVLFQIQEQYRKVSKYVLYIVEQYMCIPIQRYHITTGHKQLSLALSLKTLYPSIEGYQDRYQNW